MNNIDRKLLIFNKAAILFKTKGYVASSMRDIAHEVGIEPSSLYSHINSKEQILKQICFDCADKFSVGILLILDRDTSIKEKLLDLIEMHIDISIENPSSVTVFNDEWKHMTDAHVNEFRVMRKEYEHNIKHLLSIGMSDGFIKNMDVELLVKTFLSSLKWIHYSSHKRNIQENRTNIASFIHNLLFDGISIK